jgi:hypothetical protein
MNRIADIRKEALEQAVASGDKAGQRHWAALLEEALRDLSAVGCPRT